MAKAGQEIFGDKQLGQIGHQAKGAIVALMAVVGNWLGYTVT